jgi:hypothetical protein
VSQSAPANGADATTISSMTERQRRIVRTVHRPVTRRKRDRGANGDVFHR